MVTERFCLSEGKKEEKIQKAAEMIRAGGLVAFPTETVYGLGANALREEAAARIYAAKGRPSDNPLIVHIADRDEIYSLASCVPDYAGQLMDEFWPGPVTLIFAKKDVVPDRITGGLSTVAVRLPLHETARRLIRAAGVPIAAPSANISGRPSPTTAAHVLEDMDGRIDCILDDGPSAIGLESTIIDVTGTVPVILRPGSVSEEMVERAVGRVETDWAAKQPLQPGITPRAPGMKYRHYAPKARLTIVTGGAEAVIRRINELTVRYESEGKLCGVICTKETEAAYLCGNRKIVGSRQREESIACNLYAVLRMFDREDTEMIFSEGFDGGSLSRAIMNRLKKAAGYHIIQA